jgi:hypothetical protein
VFFVLQSPRLCGIHFSSLCFCFCTDPTGPISSSSFVLFLTLLCSVF